ncbi:MAG: transcriptional regulator [Actinomycetota bacterium]|nr:transcriptional regulator [Actinomycetota bacterium]
MGEATGGYQARLGQRLRSIRRQQALSLQQVEQRSGGRWKAVVVGAYERGDRAISAAKLAELAGFYGVPPSELIPQPPARSAAELPSGRGGIVIDLARLSDERLGDEYGAISRYASTIQLRRGDYNGRVLTMRDGDLWSLAAMMGVSSGELLRRLAEDGLLAPREDPVRA